MATDRIQLTREQLYELVWSRPIHQLAAEFGFSDVGFAKMCTRLEVPRPPRGHWRKLEAGKRSPRARLPSPHPQTPLTVDLTLEPQPPRPHGETSVPLDVPAVPISADLRGVHEVTSKLSKLLERAPFGDPPMHVLRGPYETAIRLGPDSKRRGLLILDALFKAVVARGHEVRLGEQHEHYRRAIGIDLKVVVGEEEVAIALIERSSQRDHVLTKDEREREKKGGYSWAPKHDRFATGKLQLEIGMRYGAHRRFGDGTSQRVEDKLGHAVLAVEAAAEVQLVEHERARVTAEHLELERRRQEAEREQHEHMVALGKDLLQMASRWSEADHLRAFLDAYEARRRDAETTEAEVAWISWARRFADARDPLTRLERVAKRLVSSGAD